VEAATDGCKLKETVCLGTRSTLGSEVEATDDRYTLKESIHQRD
jgi:hypothetical protein